MAKAFVVRDEQISEIIRNNNSLAPPDGVFVDDRALPNIVNLYVLGYNQNKKLVTLNLDVKKNMKTYLENYRILTDEIRILDAFVVNIGVEFDIVVYKSFNTSEVLARCISAIEEFFDIDKWQVNQPIIMNDLFLEIGRVEGVQNVTEVKVFNRYRSKDGLDYEDYVYDIENALERGVIYPSLDPCIFEVRYPERDIIGTAVQ